MKRLLTGLVLVAGCASTPAMETGASQRAGVVPVIQRELEAMRLAWNRDDLDAHVAPYADSATWMTGTGVLRGKSAIRETLVKSFQRGTDLVGELHFTDTEFHFVTPNTVYTTGTFELTNLPNGKSIKGRSTLIWTKRGDRWLIVHDHSS